MKGKPAIELLPVIGLGAALIQVNVIPARIGAPASRAAMALVSALHG
ncbi:hypothetical protein [Methylocella silvestris]|nr:hypothetical protein [Methylocella silvestris]